MLKDGYEARRKCDEGHARGISGSLGNFFVFRSFAGGLFHGLLAFRNVVLLSTAHFEFELGVQDGDGAIVLGVVVSPIVLERDVLEGGSTIGGRGGPGGTEQLGFDGLNAATFQLDDL